MALTILTTDATRKKTPRNVFSSQVALLAEEATTPTPITQHILVFYLTELSKAATKIQASFRGHQVRRNDVLHQREEDFYREMEQLHTKKHPQMATEDGKKIHLFALYTIYM